MKPPLCEYEVLYEESYTEGGHFQWDAFAIPKRCPCAASHFHFDFAAQLERFYPGLKLAWDINNGWWCIYRMIPEAHTLNTGVFGEKIGYVHNHFTVLMPLKWTFNRIINGGNNYVHLPRDPGDWVFHRLKKWRYEQINGRGSWVKAEMEAQRKAEEEASEKNLRTRVQDCVDDWMTLADGGDASLLKVSSRVTKKVGKSRKKREKVAA